MVLGGGVVCFGLLALLYPVSRIMLRNVVFVRCVCSSATVIAERILILSASISRRTVSKCVRGV